MKARGRETIQGLFPSSTPLLLTNHQQFEVASVLIVSAGDLGVHGGRGVF